MPIYEYECKKCGERFEVMQRITEEALTTCSPDLRKDSENAEEPKVKCDGDGELKKLISQTSFSLKGGGWYKGGYS